MPKGGDVRARLRKRLHDKSLALQEEACRVAEERVALQAKHTKEIKRRVACVCTVERANELVTHMTRSERADEIRFVCIDEIHTVSDSKRGYFLELLVTKIKKSAAAAQIVAMSATLRGDDALAKWMNAAFYETDFRPVPLSVTFKVNDAELDSNKNVVRTIPRQQRQRISPEARVSRDYEDLVFLCRETINERASALVFCSSRQACEKVAHQLRSEFEFSKIDYHHAGLDPDRRRCVERDFTGGKTQILCCTSTLAVGVNLPARRVIIYGFEPGDDKATKLHQMIGRAGRYGLDTSGSAVIFCSNDTEFDAALAMYRGAARSFGHTDRDSISLTAPLFLVRTGPAAYAAAAIAAKKRGAVPSRGVRGILTNSIEGV